MVWFSHFAYYALFWWLCLFGVLSIGLKTQAEAGEVVQGTEPSAPAKPRLRRVLGLNTLISAGFYAIWLIATAGFGFSIESIPSIYPQDY